MNTQELIKLEEFNRRECFKSEGSHCASCTEDFIDKAEDYVRGILSV